MRKTASHLCRILAIAIALLATSPINGQPASAATEKPTILGFASAGDWRQDLEDFALQAGRSPAVYQLFWGVESDWSAPFVPRLLDDLEARGLTPYIEVLTNDLDAINRGARDAKLDEMGSATAAWLNQKPGRHILIAPLPEMNSNHVWSDDPAGFKAGYRRIRGAFLDEGLTPRQIRFVFGPYGESGVGAYEDYYPGDAIVDIIGFAKVNNGNPWTTYEFTFQWHIDQLRSEISRVKPILITQTGSIQSGADGQSRDQWLRDMFTKLKAHDQVIGAIYFNRNKAYDYRVLVNGQLDPVFDQGYQKWSGQDEISWIFDGRMDTWVRERMARFGTGFLDSTGHTFESAINWLAAEGITTGCNPPLNTRYCPNNNVTRGQMAVFLARALNSLPEPSRDYFRDDDGMFYENAVNRLYEAGITQGCGASLYCGEVEITREQMAAFLARTLDLATTREDFFVDDGSSIFEPAINRVAAARITLGCNPPVNDRYCPTQLVTRGQMAAFIHRAFG